MEVTAQRVPRMPDFSAPQRGFHHTVDSALQVLWSLGISASRITIRLAGRGWPSRWIADQDPPAGAPLRPDVVVTLSVGGLGFFHSLPVGFWDEGGEAEPGTKEIVELFDDPIQKASHWICEGARLFDIEPQNYAACERWIRLFGLNAEHWPQERWYNLALLLPTLQHLSGREEGIRLGLRMLLDLPLSEIRREPAFRYLDDEQLSLLAARASRLSADLILGNRVEDLARLVVVIGPVSLETYYRFQRPEERDQIEELLDLCAPLDRGRRVSWLVLDPQRAPRLGVEGENARLGINSHLGTE